MQSKGYNHNHNKIKYYTPQALCQKRATWLIGQRAKNETLKYVTPNRDNNYNAKTQHIH